MFRIARSGDAEQHSREILGRVDGQPDLTPDEISEWHGKQGHQVSRHALWRLLKRRDCTLKKKTLHGGEQNRDDVKVKRRKWERHRRFLARHRIVFVDEFSASDKMVRLFGCSQRGRRCHAHVSHGHWKTTTVVAAPGPDGIVAYMNFDGAMTGARFREWFQDLARHLQPGDIVVCDNLTAHKVSGVREILKTAGAGIRFLPPYSPEFNPGEQAISRIKSFSGKASAKTGENPDAAIKAATKVVKATHARNYLRNSGYGFDPA